MLQLENLQKGVKEVVVPELTVTLAHRAAVSPPHRGPSEHAIGGSEDRGGFRERRHGRGRCCGTLRQTYRRRALGQRCLREGHVGHQIHLGNKQ